MKKLITILSILTLGISAVSFGATPQKVETEEKVKVAKVEEKATKTPEEIKWEKAHAYAHYRSETR